MSASRAPGEADPTSRSHARLPPVLDEADLVVGPSVSMPPEGSMTARRTGREPVDGSDEDGTVERVTRRGSRGRKRGSRSLSRASTEKAEEGSRAGSRSRAQVTSPASSRVTHAIARSPVSDADESVSMDGEGEKSVSSTTSAITSKPAAVPLPRRQRKPPAAAAVAARVSMPKGKAKAPAGSETEDDDDPVFVSASFKSLANKYTYVSSSSSGESVPTRQSLEAGSSKAAVVDQDELRQAVAPLPLLPDIAPSEALPIPAWLPKKAADLLQLQCCVVCKKPLKKRDSGPMRWKHISTCLPPVFRPPRDPPNLQQLIDDALVALRPRSPSTLLGHVHSVLMEGKDDGADGTKLAKSATIRTRPDVGLRAITTVRPSEERGAWDDEVDDRLEGWLASPSSVKSVAKSPRSPRSPLVVLPATQPLGVSELARDYSRPRSSTPSSTKRISPVKQLLEELDKSGADEENEPPMPPSSQKRLGPALSLDMGWTAGRTRGKSPFGRGEACEAQGASPTLGRRWDGTLRQAEDTALASGSKLPSIYAESIVLVGDDDDDDHEPADQTFTPTRPGAAGRPDSVSRGRRSLSGTPTLADVSSATITAAPESIDLTGPSPEDPADWYADDDEDQDAWGRDAVLQWDGETAEGDDDSSSSVAPRDAGLDSDEADEEDWGREAVMFCDEDDEDEAEEGLEAFDLRDAIEAPDEEEEEAHKTLQQVVAPGRSEESMADLVRRGMPAYDAWDDTKLQRLAGKYGFRPLGTHVGLVRVAVDCWTAMNPRPPPSMSLPGLSGSGSHVQKGKARARPVPSPSSSVSSVEVPLAKKKATGKGKGKAEDVLGAVSTVPIEARFRALIKDDADLYLRILRYEPISFDEFVSKAIATGIDDKGWKNSLKKFLDFQGITFFTADPQGQRRRH